MVRNPILRIGADRALARCIAGTGFDAISARIVAQQLVDVESHTGGLVALCRHHGAEHRAGHGQLGQPPQVLRCCNGCPHPGRADWRNGYLSGQARRRWFIRSTNASSLPAMFIVARPLHHCPNRSSRPPADLPPSGFARLQSHGGLFTSAVGDTVTMSSGLARLKHQPGRSRDLVVLATAPPRSIDRSQHLAVALSASKCLRQRDRRQSLGGLLLRSAPGRWLQCPADHRKTGGPKRR